jgi:DNA polymerase I-like protein with 3'-5' exonuclease and polymerase domains
MSNFNFGGLSLHTKKKEIDIPKRNPFLHLERIESSPYQVCVVLDTFYPVSLIKSLKLWLNKTLKVSYCITVVTNLDCKSDDIKQIIDFYTRNSIDIKNSLPEDFTNCIYLSVGRSLYSFTHSDDLDIAYFYDIVFNKSYFYSPIVESYVFPIDYLYLLFKSSNNSFLINDNARMKFASYQLKQITDLGNTLIHDRNIPTYSLHVLTAKKDIDEFLYKYMEFNGILSVDIETSSLSFIDGIVGCISMCLDRNNTYFLQVEHVDKSLLNTFLSNKKVIGQNYKFDYKFLKHNEINSPYPVSDTMVLGQTVNEARSNSLKTLSFLYTKFGGYDNELQTFKKKYKVTNYLDIPMSILPKYAGMDALVTFIVHEEMQKQLSWMDVEFPVEEGLTFRQYYENIAMPVYREFFDIEYEGMYIDMEKLDVVSNSITTDLHNLEKEILESLNTDKNSLDINSSKQLGIFFEKNKWTCFGRGKDGTYSTGDDQLIRWGKEGHKEAKLLQKYRSLSTLQDMFVGKENGEEGWRSNIVLHDDNTYRMHPKFGVLMAGSKRNTCKDPNLQQIPARGAYSSEIKHCITVPPEDEDGRYLFGTLDYNSLQIRLCALDSMDKFLCNLYKTDSDPDLHSTTGFSLIKENTYTFFKVKQEDVEYEFYELQNINIIRNGEKMEIMAKELDVNDVIVA